MRHLLLVPLLLLCGCMSQFLAGGDAVDRVEDWVEKEHYGEAMVYIDSLEPAHPDYAQLRRQLPEIRRSAARLERETLREGRELTRAKHWHDALVLYEAAIVKVPASERLEAARESCLAARDSQVRRLRTEALLERGRWLVRDAQFKRRISNALPLDRAATRDLKRSDRDVESVAEALHDCGLESLDRGEYAMARQCLSRAYELTPRRTIHNALAIAVVKSMEPASLQVDSNKRRERRIAKLTSAYEQAYANGELRQASRHLDTLAALDPPAKTLQRMERELAFAISVKVEVGIEAGRKLYGRGKIQPALDTWHELIPLEPQNDELNAHIARAERVLMNLNRLKAKVLDEESPAP